MQQLRHLQLSQFIIAMPALLTALRELQQLQHIDVCFGDDMGELDDAPMQQYSAFTASPQLTHLRIAAEQPRHPRRFPDALPPGAMQHIFPAGKQLPRLKQLHLNDAEADWHMKGKYMELLGPGDLAAIAAACPGLEQFWAIAAVEDDVQLIDLARMTSVTQLKIGGHYVDPAELSAAVAEMTQLQDLSVVGVIDLLPKDLAPLTQLTALRRLKLFDCSSLLARGELLLTSKVCKSCCVYTVHLGSAATFKSQLFAAEDALVKTVKSCALHVLTSWH
jgi:hypothetical protein